MRKFSFIELICQLGYALRYDDVEGSDCSVGCSFFP